MGKIGILCAGDSELEPFLPRIENPKTTERARLRFYEGRLGGKPAVLLYSGVCKVNAAVAAQLLIDCFGVDILINAGTAGGMDEGVCLFDTVVTQEAAYHDVAEDVLTDFHPWLETVFIRSDPRLLDLARRYSESCPHPIRFGRTVSGEQFIEDEKRAEILEKFSPLTVDMETAAVAHVCHVNGIPFMAVRTVTDTAAHAGLENFEKNCAAASSIAAEIVTGIVESIDLGAFARA